MSTDFRTKDFITIEELKTLCEESDRFYIERANNNFDKETYFMRDSEEVNSCDNEEDKGQDAYLVIYSNKKGMILSMTRYAWCGDTEHMIDFIGTIATVIDEYQEDY